MPTNIGVLSSIPCEFSFRDFLESEISANVPLPATFTYKDDKKTAAGLNAALQQFNTGANAVDWIITLGGRIAYNQTVNATSAGINTKPFVSLVGADPYAEAPQPPPLFKGGVSLESYGHNKDRADYLINQKGFTANNSISLYQNQFSPLATAETAAWQALQALGHPQLLSNPIPAFTSAAPNPKDYANTVDGITTQAVIISPDPFFQKTKHRLVGALNDSGLYVCYPLYNYANASPSPAPGSSTLLGSTLEHAIKVLAVAASLAINGAPINRVVKEPPGKAKDL
jgi:hypothetical protein